MLSTIVLTLVCLTLLLVWFVLWAVFLRLGLRWAKVEGITIRRILYATAAVFALQVLSSILTGVLVSSVALPIVPAALVLLAVVVLSSWFVIAYVCKSRLRDALQAWIPTLVAPAIIVVLVLFLVHPFLMEPLAVPTNAMAPTLLGDHVRGICPECGRPSFATPIDPARRLYSPRFPLMICRNFHVSQGTVAAWVFPGDRFLAAKYLKPRRWDLLVFRSPRDPSILYVKRIVGLPGEEIHIADGAVWADGTKLTPPAAIRGIRHLSEFPRLDVWGTINRPAKLAADEYFVLGDFSAQSEDSRFWTQGAPGHPPFAIPQSYVYGVATHICWPPQRWRILR